jgi:putative lipoprotein
MRLDYSCEGGTRLTVYLHNETVKVLFKDHLYLMRQVISGSGTRYSDGKLIWWSKAEGGFLQTDAADGDSEMIVKDCHLSKAMNSAATPDSVSGTVSYLLRIRLPPSAVIQVQLQDVSRADAPATIIAQDKIPLGDRQGPIPFELKFDPTKIDPQHPYSVSARIFVGEQLRFITDKPYPVLTRGNRSHVDMILKLVAPVDTNKPGHSACPLSTRSSGQVSFTTRHIQPAVPIFFHHLILFQWRPVPSPKSGRLVFWSLRTTPKTRLL